MSKLKGRDMTFEGKKSGTKSGTKKSKDSISYWESRVEKRSYSYKGETRDRSEYSVRFSVHGKRRLIPLQTSNKAKAAEKARDLYVRIRANGWSVVDEDVPPPLPRLGHRDEVTCGDYIRIAELVSAVVPTTFVQYLASLRRIVAFSNDIPVSKERHDHVSGGRERWNAKVDACPLFPSLTINCIERFRRHFLKRYKDNALHLQKGQRSFNKVMRDAKGLLSNKMRHALEVSDANPEGIEFPSRLGLLEATNEPEGSKRFDPKKEFKITLPKLFKAAEAELDPDQLIALLLALTAGLRRGEIDRLRWDSVDLRRKQLTVETTEDGKTKSAASEGCIPLDPQVVAKLTEYKKTSGKRRHVLPGVSREGISKSWTSYRANVLFQSLVEWLRGKGVDGYRPIHTLRKMAGSEVARDHGIYAAASLLRHASTAVTEQHYVAPAPKTPGFGKYLS
jgi:integrase